MQSLKNKELDCIRFYMGDPDVQDTFRGGLKAYNTINALLHKGIQNELDLISENRVIEIYDQDHLKQYLDLMINIYQSMIHYVNEYENHHFITYKIDRYSTILQMKKNQYIEGFFSTCKYGYLEEYAHIKKDVVLIEIVRDCHIPYLDFECLFQEKYAKKDEAEILIPFHTKISLIEEIELSDDEKNQYFDMNGHAPIGKYRIHLVNENIVTQRIDEFEILKDVERVQSCISNLMKHQEFNQSDLDFYTKWKDDLRNYLLYKIFE